MDDIKNLLEVRERLKGRKPEFIRRDFHKRKRLKRNWRKPTGLDSKVRRRLKGRQMRISQGYRSPRKVRGLHKSGLMQVRVCSLKDLEGLEPKKECIVISSAVGAKKKLEILNKAKSSGFNIVNSNVEAHIKKVQERISSGKKKKEEKKNEIQETKAKEEKIPEKAEEKDVNDAGKKEKDKVLTKREI